MPCQCGAAEIGTCTYGYGSCNRPVCSTHGGNCPGCGEVFCRSHLGDHSPGCTKAAKGPLFSDEDSTDEDSTDAPVAKEKPLPKTAAQPESGIGAQLKAHYADETCPSCGLRYDDVKLLAWARIVQQKEESTAFNIALRAICQEEDLDAGVIDAELSGGTSGEGGRAASSSDLYEKALRIQAAARERARAKPLSKEQATKVFVDMGVQSVDAHNVIGQNAIKTGSSRLDQGNHGTHSVMEEFYRRHDCRGLESCVWKVEAAKLESLIGTGAVMAEAYCQRGKGAQCKVCESIQGEWHLLQRGSCLLSNARVPLQFVGLQWCRMYCGGEASAEAVRSRPAAFLAFLRKCTEWQIERNLAALNDLIGPGDASGPAVVVVSSTASGATGTEMRAVATPCPAVLAFIKARRAEFEAFYRERFLQICEMPPHHAIDAERVISGFTGVNADAVVATRRLWTSKETRPSDAQERGFDAEVKRGTKAHNALVQVMPGGKMCSSGKEAKAFLTRGVVKVDGVVIGEEYTFDGPPGTIVSVTVVVKKQPVTRTFKIV